MKSKPNFYIFILLLHFVNVNNCYSSDTDTTKKAFITGGSANFGSGINTLGNPGFGGGLNLNFLVSNKYALTLSFIQSEGDIFGGGESIKDYSVLGGLVLSKRKKIIVIASGGISRVEVDGQPLSIYYNGPSTGYGLPLHGKLIYSPIPFVNFGINAFFNFNKFKPVAGALITVGFGFIDQEK